MDTNLSREVSQYVKKIKLYQKRLRKAKGNLACEQDINNAKKLEEEVFDLKWRTMSAFGERYPRHFFHMSVLPVEYPASTKDHNALRALDVKSLIFGTHHQGTFMLLRAVHAPYRMKGITTLMEDARGDLVQLQLLKQEPEAKRPATDVVDTNTVLLIKEPYYGLLLDGYYGVRADHVTDVVPLDWKHELLPDHWRTAEPESLPSASAINDEGNVAFKAKKFWRAIRRYSYAIDCNPTVEEKSALLRNRATAFLEVGRCDQALIDAGYPDCISAPNERALQRAAQALYHLRRFSEAREVGECLDKNFPGSEKYQKLLEQIIQREQEATKGSYRFPDLQQDITSNPSVGKDTATYIGPIEIRPSKIHGRGTFLTTSVKSGDLLLCEKAFAYVEDVTRGLEGSKRFTEAGFDYNMKTNTTTKGNFTNLAEAIIDKLGRNPSEITTFMDLYPGNCQVEKHTEAVEAIDTYLVERITKHCQTRFSISSKAGTKLRYHRDIVDAPAHHTKANYVGIWTRGSYINNDCIPNAHDSYIGDMLIVRACTDLCAGTEVTVSYNIPPSRGPVALATTDNAFRCNCVHCEEVRAIPDAKVRQRTKLLDDAKQCLHLKKAIMYCELAAKTYRCPATKVPRRDLAQAYDKILNRFLHRITTQDQGLLPDLMGTFASTLQNLGFEVDGIDLSAADIRINTWGRSEEYLITSFRNCEVILSTRGLSAKARQAEQHAKLFYKIIFGEDQTFESVPLMGTLIDSLFGDMHITVS